ncbi:hypothetical protein ACIRPU_09875 [Streptomyces sp. NPDC102259]|uniref:hypothetical protein n=1 Tax=Streptomyces sp. NPDC102259 TaxID=3366148 RepID=UPI00380A32C1
MQAPTRLSRRLADVFEYVLERGQGMVGQASQWVDKGELHGKRRDHVREVKWSPSLRTHFGPNCEKAHVAVISAYRLRREFRETRDVDLRFL